MSEFRLTHPPKYRSNGQREADYYPTPAWCTRLLLTSYPPPWKHLVVEPSAGEGHIVAELLREGYPVQAIELREECRAELLARGVEPRIADWFDVCREPWIEHASIVGNPPFSLALEFARSCLASGADYVALLLRLGFLASQERRPFNLAHPPTMLLPLAKRPSFTGDGATDSQEYAWFVWDRTETRALSNTIVEVLG